MLTAILTTSGQNSSAFRRKEKSSETKQQKIESNGWFRLASISCCCCRWRASARCRRTCAERDLQNVTYHNNCYEKKFSEKNPPFYSFSQQKTISASVIRNFSDNNVSEDARFSFGEEIFSIFVSVIRSRKDPDRWTVAGATKRPNNLDGSFGKDVDLGSAFNPD